ncbi:UPF0503 protein, chloroplastic, partial [Tanacetum coccineum]
MTSSKLPVEKPISRQYRETQSEIADYGYGRRSCDTDPRFSLDAGRVSFDDPRYSFDEPRASWDGYLIGRTFPRLSPMVEDVPHVPVVPVVPRCDMQIPVEEVRVVADGDVPGRIRLGNNAAAVVAELDESKVKPASGVSNSKVSPTNEPPRVSNSNSLRDDCGSETFELGFRDNSSVGVGFRDNGVGVGNGFRGSLGGEEKKEMKKPRRWKWKLWGLIHRRGKDDDEDRCSSVSGVGRSYSESWQDGTNGINGGMNRNVFRISEMSKLFDKETVIYTIFFLLPCARYSPNHIDNGLLRFYLAPLSGSRRGGIGIATGKSRGSSNNSHSIARKNDKPPDLFYDGYHDMDSALSSNDSDANSPKEPSPDGDAKKQELLARIAMLQAQKVRLTDFLDERSAYLTQFAEEANVEFDQVGEN